MSDSAPICLFVYNRLQQTRATIDALLRNPLAAQSDLHIFSDGPKVPSDTRIYEVRSYIRSVRGFRSITIHESPENRGLARSIISGVTKILESHPSVIVLEDDLLTSTNFLVYMNKALEFYENQPKAFAISGFSYPLNSLKHHEFDNTFGYRSYSWGWATWKDRWEIVDWEVSDYKSFMQSRKQQRNFSKGGSDLCRMLKNQMEGKIDSWMIRWVYAQFKHSKLDVFPKISKVKNIGFGEIATHTDTSQARFQTQLDESGSDLFKFDPIVEVSASIQKELEWKHSIARRIIYRLIAKTKIFKRN